MHAVLFPIKVKCVVTETHPIKVSNFPLLIAGNDCCVSQKVYRILLDLYFTKAHCSHFLPLKWLSKVNLMQEVVTGSLQNLCSIVMIKLYCCGLDSRCPANLKFIVPS